MNQPAKPGLRILFGCVAALAVFGWVQGLVLVARGEVSDALWWLIGASVLAADVVRRRRTYL